jgi:hypothetical protein
VCVKGESCEYEHLGRPLVVDEAGLSKLQSDRGTLLLLPRLSLSLSLSLLLTDPRPRLDQKTPRKPVPTIRRIRSSTRPAPSRCGMAPRPELRLPCHAVGGASPVPACSTRPCSPCRPCLTRRDWAIRVRHHHHVCSHGLSPRAWYDRWLTHLTLRTQAFFRCRRSRCCRLIRCPTTAVTG